MNLSGMNSSIGKKDRFALADLNASEASDIMKRRNFIQLALTGLAGCGENRKSHGAMLEAGPFRVTVPESWRESAIIENIAMVPVYHPEEWAAYRQDSHRVLKPSYVCRPQHWAMRFPSALPPGIPFQRENAGADPTAPQILIHKADEWAVAFTDGRHMETPVGEVLAGLRKSVDDAMNDESPPRLPCFMDASLGFVCLKKRLRFAGGTGVRMIAQWNTEPSLMTFGKLHYLFSGMSEDDSCQIIASFPLDLAGLPRAQDQIHLGHSMGQFDQFSVNFATYAETAIAWLRENESSITPPLSTLDEVIKSLVVSGWKS
ncbi:MAG: hypothetical protein RL346_1214 [Verrucomicrobiota bacterium]|jgi:hypothetical protein